MENVIQTQDLGKRYLHCTALRGLTMQIPKGSIYGLVGKNGAGKTTLIRILTGLQQPTSGQYSLYGVPHTDPDILRCRRRMGAVVETPSLYLNMTAQENLRLQYRVLGLPSEDSIPQLLELVGLPADFAGRFPHELSGGQLQRVCIARAVACSPEVILFDEAISSLDAHTQVQVMDLLRELKEKLGLTYVFITHDLTSITYLCDDVLFLYQGRVTEYLPVCRISETKDEYARRLLESIVVFDTEENEVAV